MEKKFKTNWTTEEVAGMDSETIATILNNMSKEVDNLRTCLDFNRNELIKYTQRLEAIQSVVKALNV